MQVGCSRCQRASDVTFATPAVALPSSSPTPASAAGAARSAPAQHSGGLEWGGECGHCHSPMLVQLVPRMVHDRSNVLAVIRAEGCTPMDLLPSMLAGQCGRYCGPGVRLGREGGGAAECLRCEAAAPCIQYSGSLVGRGCVSAKHVRYV